MPEVMPVPPPVWGPWDGKGLQGHWTPPPALGGPPLRRGLHGTNAQAWGFAIADVKCLAGPGLPSAHVSGRIQPRRIDSAPPCALLLVDCTASCVSLGLFLGVRFALTVVFKCQ